MTYGKFCGQRVAPPKKKTHKITEEISCSLQHAEEIRRQNVRGMLQRWGFTACGKTWQNMFFLPECGTAAIGWFQRFSTNMVGMIPKECQ